MTAERVLVAALAALAAEEEEYCSPGLNTFTRDAGAPSRAARAVLADVMLELTPDEFDWINTKAGLLLYPLSRLQMRARMRAAAERRARHEERLRSLMCQAIETWAAERVGGVKCARALAAVAMFMTWPDSKTKRSRWPILRRCRARRPQDLYRELASLPPDVRAFVIEQAHGSQRGPTIIQ